eukprot:132504-Hanusia_phi.AAC.1
MMIITWPGDLELSQLIFWHRTVTVDFTAACPGRPGMDSSPNFGSSSEQAYDSYGQHLSEAASRKTRNHHPSRALHTRPGGAQHVTPRTVLNSGARV